MHSFTYKGHNSRDYCKLFVSGGGTFGSPERDIESIPIPGRNGELTIDNGRYKNVTVEYSGWIAEDFEANILKARQLLCYGNGGYYRLEDDYHPDEFRMARFVGPLEVQGIASSGDYLAAALSIKFDCMPHRFLKSGEEVITLTAASGTNVINPTSMPALPLITVHGSGEGTIIHNLSTEITVGNIDGSVTMDSEIMRAYKGNVPKDDTVSDFLVFDRRTNYIQFSGGITSIEIIPRWWRL